MKLCKLIGLYVLFTAITTFDIIGYAAVTGNGTKQINEPIKLSKEDITNAKIIQKLIVKRNWGVFKKNILKIQNPLLKKTLFWQYCISANSGATFHEINGLVQERPEWPLNKRLRQRAEEAMTPGMDPEHVISWFEGHSPLTVDGGINLAEALLEMTQKSAARKTLRQTWVGGNFGAKQERQFYKQYRGYLTRQDHLDRLERLLWRGNYSPVRRMFNKVNKDYRALAFARITLRQYKGAVDSAISKVPKRLLNDPGLVFERFRWRRRKGRDEDAFKILQYQPKILSYPTHWWNEKVILARRFLRDGNISAAYTLASKHGLKSGQSFVEAEWLAGWIAMKFLNESGYALNHFETVFNGSKYPISRARGAYWAGRASEFLKNETKIVSWYKKAAAYSLTYYGQHASAKLDADGKIIIPSPVPLKKTDSREFLTNKFVKVVQVLGAAELYDFIKPFINKLNKIKSSAEWHGKVAILASENGRPDLAVYTAKKAYRNGIMLIKEGYPVVNISDNFKIELALLYALIRQESAFNTKATSSAGAKGLMQIMPSTAKRIAKKYKIAYSKHKLTSDADYNLKFGKTYLSGLLNKYDGSHTLSLAAYNAGPSRANAWIKRNGDPRSADVDVIDWIEMIPFKETRNYVQRVIENYNVYRKYLSSK